MEFFSSLFSPPDRMLNTSLQYWILNMYSIFAPRPFILRTDTWKRGAFGVWRVVSEHSARARARAHRMDNSFLRDWVQCALYMQIMDESLLFFFRCAKNDSRFPMPKLSSSNFGGLGMLLLRHERNQRENNLNGNGICHIRIPAAGMHSTCHDFGGIFFIVYACIGILTWAKIWCAFYPDDTLPKLPLAIYLTNH